MEKFVLKGVVGEKEVEIVCTSKDGKIPWDVKFPEEMLEKNPAKRGLLDELLNRGRKPQSTSKFTKVKPPMFKVMGEWLNEYELRTLQLEVAQGKKLALYVVEDEAGNKANINEDGRLSSEIEGLDVADNIVNE